MRTETAGKDSARPVRVFISYSHDSEEHKDRVAELAETLRSNGVDCVLDRWEPNPPEGWPRWMDRQIEEAEFVLVVCTETYYRRATGREERGRGHGTIFESLLIVQDLYDAGMRNEKFIPVLFEPMQPSELIRPLRGVTRYRIDTKRGYEDLLRHLLDKPRHVKPDLGQAPDLPPDSPSRRSSTVGVSDEADAGVRRSLMGRAYHLGEHGKKIAEAGLPVTLLETGETVTTDDHGRCRLPLPESYQAGEVVHLEVDKPGWRIRYPLDGELTIPFDLRPPIAVELLQAGSKLFWTPDRIEKFVEGLAESTKQQVRAEQEIDFSQALREWADRFGVSPDDATAEIEAWIVEVEQQSEDSYQLGLAHFAEKKFALAAEQFRSSAERKSERLEALWKEQENLATKEDELRREMVRDFRKEGEAHLAAYDFKAALEAFQRAVGYLTEEMHPHLWAATQRDLGIAAKELGIRVGGGAARRYLGDAVKSYRESLKVHTRNQPQDWAMTQNNLGLALQAQGIRVGGEEGVRLLGESVSAYRQALEVYTRDELPQEWAMTQNNLGIALQAQGIRVGSEEGVRLLGESVGAYRQALEVRTRDQLPQDWAMTQNNLGLALQEQGIRVGNEEGVRLLGESVSASRQALEVRTRDQLPQEWAITQNNLGNALQAQGIRVGNEEGVRLLGESVSAYRQALEIHTRDQLPQRWAATQDNLGAALREQGVRVGGEEGVRLLGESVGAHRQALEVHTRAELPQGWATTQNNLGAALQEQGIRVSGEEREGLLDEAIGAYRNALEVFTAEALPGRWAIVQKNLEKALAIRAGDSL